MKAEAWLVIEFPKPKHDWMKVEPKITKLYQKRPSEGLAVKVVLEMPDKEWEPTVLLELSPLQVKGSVDSYEARERLKASAHEFFKDNQ